VNNLNELTTIANNGTLTVAGTTTVPATNVTVNGLTANRYADATFALGGFTRTNGNNTFTAIGWDYVGNSSSNSVTVNLPGTDNYSYDLNGNLLSDGNRNFAYDDENELTNVWVANAWQSVFVYDGKLRRRIESDYTWQNGTWLETNEIHFIYDGNVVIQERDANNLPKETYTRGNDLSGTLQGAGGIGGLLARTDSGLLNAGSMFAQAYYHADGNGNVTCLIYTNQQIAAKYLYDPYANTLAMSGLLAGANKYRFSSKEWNDNAGLYYYLYRFYDPNLQRWPNQDPLGEPGFETLRSIWPEADSTAGYVDAYLYLFVANNPLMFVDTDGRVLWPPSQWEWPHKVKNWFKNPKPPKIPGVPSNCSVGPWFGNDPYGSYGPKVYGGQISWSF